MRIPSPAVLTVILSAAPALVAQVVLEVEPNNTPATAQPIVAGQHVKATYTTAAPTDDDWFSFTLAAPAQVHVHASAGGTLVLGISRDNRIAIYDATGTTRLAWNDSAVGSMADCGVTLPAGSYTAVVNLKTGGVAGNDYGLDLHVLPVNPIDTTEGAEPNDATGIPTTFVLGDTVAGELASSADVDFWKFTLTGRGIVQAASYDDAGAPQLDNLALRYHQETSPGMWTALGSGDAVNSASHRVTTLSHTGMLAAGSYAVAVKAGTAAAGTAPWDYTKVGHYSLRTCLIDMPGTSTIAESAEPNGNTATPAGVITLGDDTTGSTTGNTEEDWYLFAIGGPTTVGAMAEGTGASPLPGSTVKIYDSLGVAIATASGNSTTHGKLVFTINAPGIYYLSVSGAFAATAGDYVLHTGACAPLYVSNTTRMEPASTNGCPGSNTLRPLLGSLSGELPAFDSTFITRIERTIPSSVAVVMLGFSNTVAFGSIPLPFDMAFFDAPGCFVRVDPLVNIGVPTDASGTGELIWNFPYAVTDIGLKIYQQALCFDPTLNGFGWSVSNDGNFVLGDRPF